MIENHFIVLCDHDIEICPFPKFPHVSYHFHQSKQVRADLNIPKGKADSRLSSEIVEIVMKKKEELPEFALLHAIVSTECLYRLDHRASIMSFAPHGKLKHTRGKMRLVYNNRFFDFGTSYLGLIQLVPLYESSIDKLETVNDNT